jgi:4-aminobutyrate aminotransferase-like enzyme
MELFSKLIAPLLSKQKVVYTGPNTLDELLEQFDKPPKEKTQQDIIRDYQVKETMAALELSYLKDDPSLIYHGNQVWYDHDGNKYFDFVTCVVRPEVHYCCYGKN